jgi:hypothetical protein
MKAGAINTIEHGFIHRYMHAEEEKKQEHVPGKLL